MQTIRIGYIETEDRVLAEFISPNSKVTFLITRRIMRRVIRGIAQLLARSSRAVAHAPVDVKVEVLILEHQSAIQAADIANAQGASNTAGATDEPASLPPELLEKIDIHTHQRTFHLTFTGRANGSGGGGTAQILDLSRSELHRLLASLHKLAHSADWNLENEVGWLKEADAPFTPPTKAAS